MLDLILITIPSSGKIGSPLLGIIIPLAIFMITILLTWGYTGTL